MKRTRLIIIVVLMSVALIGLASFQVYWINNTIDLNREAFKETVRSSLRQVAAALERREVVNLVSKSFYTIEDKTSLKEQYKLLYTEERIDARGKSDIIIGSDSLTVKSALDRLDSYNNIKPTKPLPAKIHLFIDSSAIDTNQHQIFARNQMVNLVIEQLVNPTSIHDRLNYETIDSLLHQKLDENGIDIEFKFAVWNAESNEIITSNTQGRSEELLKSDLKAELFPSDIIANTNYLLLNFPGETSYLYRQIWSTLAASVLFILIVVSCFGYAIYVIFRQKKLSEMKTDFINNMTHELKTPIATVSLAVEALSEKEMRSNEHTLMRYLGMIKEENTRLSAHVEKVLQSALLDREDFELKQDNIHLHELIEQCLRQLAIRIADKGGSVTKNFEATNDHIVSDEHHLTHVILNLLDNAIKYAEDQLEIRITTKNTNDWFELTIADNGMGMSQETQKMIFNKFYRAHTGDRHDVKGFGLGLSYVKTIIDKLGGQISVDSELGKGSTFKVRIANG